MNKVIEVFTNNTYPINNLFSDGSLRISLSVLNLLIHFAPSLPAGNQYIINLVFQPKPVRFSKPNRFGLKYILTNKLTGH
jgi:hypothetical protein